MYLRNSDWPGAEEAADKLEALAGGGEPQIPPEVQQQIQQGMELIQKLQAENEALKADQQGKAQERQIQQQEMQINAAGAAGDRELKQMELQIKAAELQLKQFEAETSRMQAMKPDPEPPSRNAAVN
jgi:histidyl-tRNA synthetase